MSNEASGLSPLWRSVSRPVRSMARTVKIGKLVGDVIPLRSREYVKVFRRARRLCRKKSFLPEEICQFGLLDPELTEEEIGDFVSKKNMCRILRRVNPTPWAQVTNNKAIMHGFLEGGGVPGPKTYAVFCRETAGWTTDGRYLKGLDEWCRFIAEELPDEFLIKPTEGSLGEGVVLYRRKGSGFEEFSKGACTAGDIYDAMAGDENYDSYIIQERLHNHAELVRLSGVENLQTIRVVSLIDLKGEVRILRGQLKLIVGDNLTDNFDYGATGNIQAEVCVESGRLRRAITGVRGGRILRHPETGVRFEDFVVPCWEEACEMVTKAARLFAPSRSIGWDVAITPKGPAILEGNTWWNPPNQHRCMAELTDALKG